MRTRNTFFSVLAAAVLLSAAAQAEPVVLVVPHDFGTHDLSSQDAARIFLGLTHDVGGKRVSPVVVADKASRGDVIARAVGREPGAVERHYVKLELRGEGRWPALVASAQVATRRIVESASIEGRPIVIACMSLDDYEALSPKHQALLRVVTVDGKAPEAPGYPLNGQK